MMAQLKLHLAVLALTALLRGCTCQFLKVEETDVEEEVARRRHHRQNSHDHHFDFLMFTQIWPITSCLTWEDRGYQHTCTINDSAKLWTIHGIWPTQNHKIGPLFCNRTDHFDVKKIESLLPELRSKWTDVRAGGGDEYNFWKHEWEKHGTCAEQLPSMHNEYLYFKKALDLHSQYNVTALLGDQVAPGYKYDPSTVVARLSRALRMQDGLSGSPAVNCARDKDFEDKLFYEIIICFDKDFKRIGCENTKGGIYGSCGEDPFFCPNTIHPNWLRNSMVMIMFPVLSLLCMPLACSVVYFIFGKRRTQGYIHVTE